MHFLAANTFCCQKQLFHLHNFFVFSSILLLGLLFRPAEFFHLYPYNLRFMRFVIISVQFKDAILRHALM